MKIQGYLILRKPKFNFDELGRGAYSRRPPELNGLFYGGIERMPWFDMDELYYAGEATSQLDTIRKSIFDNASDNTDIKLCVGVKDTISVLNADEKYSNLNEIIAVYSDSLKYQPICKPNDYSLKEIGVDLYCEGYGSIIRSGVFDNTKLFSEFIPMLNSDGIFDNDDINLEMFIQHYYSKISSATSLEKPEGEIKKVSLFRMVLK